MSARLSSTRNVRSGTGASDGLPYELWRYVFGYLGVQDLCRCSQVCKAWRHLVASLDGTTWKNHFFNCSQWKHSHWPRFSSAETPRPWQVQYIEHHKAARLWSQGLNDKLQTKCLLVFPSRRERKTIYVGPGCDFITLKSALEVATEYDRIMVNPGVYDEQFEMSSKIPFELIGNGPLGSVVLIMSIEQNAPSARLCNLVLKTPWFTGHVIKVMTGHLQVDNCTIKDGQIVVQSPGTCHFRYCSFVRLQMSLQHILVSVIENCEFNGCDSSAVSVEGYPKADSNRMYPVLLQHIDKYRKEKILEELYNDNNEDLLSLGSHDNLSLLEEAEDEIDSIGVASIAGSQASLNSDNDDTSTIVSSDTHYTNDSKQSRVKKKRRKHLYKKHRINMEEVAGINMESSSSDSSSAVSLPELENRGHISPLWSSDSESVVEAGLKTSFKDMIDDDPTVKEMISSTMGPVIRHCLFTGCHGGVAVARQGQCRVECNEFRDLQYGLRCLQNAKVAIIENEIHHCVTSGIFLRLAAHGIIAGNNIYYTNEAGIDVRRNADPVIMCNTIHHSKRSGVVVLGDGCGTVRGNDIYQNKEAGIYILYRSNPYVTGNRICHGGAAGIAVNEEGKGFIVDNFISKNKWGGIDIRHRSDPKVSKNTICNGLGDGIVIGEGGRGTIEGNTIKGNNGCGIWVMCGQPLIQMNQIYNNCDTGVAFVQSKDGDDTYSADDVEDTLSDHGSDFEPHNYEGDNISASEAPTLHPRLNYNTVFHNNGFGILANSAEPLVMSGNAVHDNRDIGIIVKQSAHVTIENNSITSNAGTGVQVSQQSAVTIEGNGIYENQESGLEVKGLATIVSNDIFSNQKAALTIEGTQKVRVVENRVHAPKDAALRLSNVAENAINFIKDNEVYKGETELFCIEEEFVNKCGCNKVIDKDDSGQCDKRSKKYDWHLENPPPRPHIEAPVPVVPKTPVRQVAQVTRIIVPQDGACHQGSQLCVIL